MFQNLKTVKEVAEELQLTDSRVRQLCREHEIGQIVGRDRLLTAGDVRKIKRIPRVLGRPRKNVDAA